MSNLTLRRIRVASTSLISLRDNKGRYGCVIMIRISIYNNTVTVLRDTIGMLCADSEQNVLVASITNYAGRWIRQ
jgi:hypothetical protein